MHGQVPQAVDQDMILLAPSSPFGKMVGFGQLGGSVKEKACWTICVALVRADLSPSLQAVLKNLAEALGGYYHCYSQEMEVSPSANAVAPLPLLACLQDCLQGIWARDHTMYLLPPPQAQ